MTSYKTCLRTGAVKGWRSYLWVLKILVPVSLATTLLHYSGLTSQLGLLLIPLMNPIGLPGEAAVPLLIGLTAGFYPGLAAMSALPFSAAQFNLLAIFMLQAHNLPQEGLIQAKSGLGTWKAMLVRLVIATATVWCCSWFMDDTTLPLQAAASASPEKKGLWELLRAWSGDSFWLCLNIFLIVLPIHMLLELIKARGWEQKLSRPLRPVLALMGLSRRTGFVWVAAITFGLIYGAALIMDEAKQGYLSPEELEDLQLSIGLNHAILEDSILFLALGCSIFWVMVPRFVAAAAAVHLARFIRKLRRGMKPAGAV